MRLIQDAKGRWIGRPAFTLKPLGDRPPVAIDDVALADVDGAAILIAVLTNDIDPEGGSLTLVSTFAALGTATVDGNRVRYVPPAGFAGIDTVVYEVSDAAGQTSEGQVTVTVAVPVLTAVATDANLIEMTAANGPADIAVTEPAELAGTYAVDLGDLAQGPVHLVAPSVSGTAEIGGTLTAGRGLWIHAAGQTPVRTWSWTRNGAPIAGATGASRVVEAADAGTTLAAVETLSDTYGIRAASSAGTAIAPAGFVPGDDAQLIGWWDADDAATLTQTAGAVSSWASKAGGAAALTQNSGFAQPDVGTRQVNGRQTIDFPDTLHHLTASVTLPASRDFAIHMMVAIDGAASEYAGLLAMDATADFQIDAGAADQFAGRLNVTGIGSTTALSGGPFTGPLVVSAVFDRTGANQAQIFIAGLLRGTMTLTAPVDSAVALHVMTNRSKNAGVQGCVGEILLTGATGNRADYHAYLATKWGLT